MGQAASQASAFYREVAQVGRLWTLSNEDGFPMPTNPESRPVIPFWSSLTRVGKIIETVTAFSNYEPYELAWSDFAEKWVPDLKANGIHMGVNWSGVKATGYDLDAETVVQAVSHHMKTDA